MENDDWGRRGSRARKKERSPKEQKSNTEVTIQRQGMPERRRKKENNTRLGVRMGSGGWANKKKRDSMEQKKHTVLKLPYKGKKYL